MCVVCVCVRCVVCVVCEVCVCVCEVWCVCEVICIHLHKCMCSMHAQIVQYLRTYICIVKINTLSAVYSHPEGQPSPGQASTPVILPDRVKPTNCECYHHQAVGNLLEQTMHKLMSMKIHSTH